MAASSPARRPWPPFPSRSLLLSGRLAAGRHPSSAAASSLPAPQRLASRLRPQGSAEGPQAGCSEVFIGISIKMRTTGVLRAFRSWPSRQAGSRVSRGIWSPRTVASVFGLVVPLWPVSSRTSCGAFVACRWLRWRGHHFPTAVATLTELRVCRRQVGRNVLRPLQGSGEMLLKRQ